MDINFFLFHFCLVVLLVLVLSHFAHTSESENEVSFLANSGFYCI